jgi:flavin-binding protein dodecin
MAPSPEGQSVYRVVTIVATHPNSWSDAVVEGIGELAKTITDLRVARVVEFDTVVRRGHIERYRVKLQVSFRIDRLRMLDGKIAAVRRYLVVANQTISDAALTRALEERMAVGPAEFHLLVPARVSTLAGTTLMVQPWSGFAIFDKSVAVAKHDEARSKAQPRLDSALQALRARGAVATGEISLDDPFAAVASVLQRAAFDEIIVSTLPASLSRWMRKDLPRRLHRRFGLPVTHVEQSSPRLAAAGASSRYSPS